MRKSGREQLYGAAIYALLQRAGGAITIRPEEFPQGKFQIEWLNGSDGSIQAVLLFAATKAKDVA